VRRHAKAATARSTSGQANRFKHLALALFAAFAVALMVSGAAIALQTHVKGTDVSSAGTPKGFVSLAGLAVDQSGGDLYAVDSSGAADESGALDRFNSAGSFQNQISGTFSGPQDAAVDSSGTGSDGNVYLTDTGNNLVLAFDSSGAAVSSFSGDGVLDGSGIPAALNPDGAFSSPCGLAVDQATGNLYVADSGHNRIWVFDSSGAYLDRIADSILQGPCGLAFDSTGDLYVRNSSSSNVVKFDKVGATDFNYTGSVLDSNNATDIAVDTSNDHVYVDNGSAATEYDASGTQVSAFGSFSGSNGIAVDAANEKIYVADGGSLHVFGPLTTLPDVVTGPPSSVQANAATITGSVDPAGGPDASCSFQWGAVDQFGEFTYTNSSPCQPTGPFNAFQAVTAGLSGLTVGTTYHYRIISETANGTAFGADQSFTSTNAPLISVVQATEVNATNARLRAVVNPNGSETAYHFEYGTDTSYGQNAPVPDVSFGSGSELTATTQLISGLQPDTTYHYRLHAENGAGPMDSDDHTFHTYPAQSESGLAEGRAYEMVSPPDKAGSDIQGNLWQTVSSVDGNAITFTSSGAFAGSGGTSTFANYLAQRGPEGWVTNGLSPSQEPGDDPLPGTGNQSQYLGSFTPDLSKGIFYARVPLFDEPNLGKGNALYLRDDLRSGDGPNPDQGADYHLLSDPVTPITQNQQGYTTDPFIGVADSTKDLGHILYVSHGNLTQDAVGLDQEFGKAYEWDNGTQRLVGVLPGGTPTISVAGAGVIPNDVPGTYGCNTVVRHRYSRGSLSADGSAAFFTAPPYGRLCDENVDFGAMGVTGALYVRRNHAVTEQINASERTDCATDPTCGGDGVPDPAPDSQGPNRAMFWTATPDGAKAFFETSEALTDEATHSSATGLNLYIYDQAKPAGDRLTLVANQAKAVVGASDDFLYFENERPDLDPSFEFPKETFHRYLYVWHDGEIRAVGWATEPTTRDLYLTGVGRFSAARMLADGQSLLFTSDAGMNATFSGTDNTTVGSMKKCSPDGGDGGQACAQEIYLYDYGADSLTCVSCSPTGAAPSFDGAAFNLSLNTTGLRSMPTTVSGYPTQYLTNAFSEDGNHAFFTSFDPLVPTDTNGRADAYVYNALTGKVHLLSTGECNCDSSFVEASPDGNDAFIVTAQRLVGIDKDNSRDLYDVRIGGGIAAQNPSPLSQCQGDACQTPAVPPNDPTPSSSSFNGAGNEKNTRQKPRKARKHAKKHKKQRKHQKQRGKAAQQGKQTTTRSHG
jgi:DNA-binding beta-propeller fold protein YncE